MAKNPQNQPLASPPTVDKDWAAKIAKAKEARESGQKLREGKPVTFPVRRLRPS